MIGKTISHYKIIEHLGSGGMGIVYKAEDTKLKRTVALKFLPQDLTRDHDAQTRFIHEAQAASALDHQNICTIHEINETEDGQTYIVMACYEGHTLKQLIEDRPLQINETILIIHQIAQGLSKAHRKGIVHRDIKPANIIIDEDNIAKILDFGLAKLSGQTVLTRAGTMMGTIKYMSPEQTRSDLVDQRSDIWALGVLLYEMLTGQPPFMGDYEQAIIYSILNEQPQPISLISKEIPSELNNIVTKALEKDPDERYQSIDEMLQDFESLNNDVLYRKEESFPKFLVRALRKKTIRYATFSAGIMIILIITFIFLKPIGLKDTLNKGPKPIMVISFENQTGDKAYELWENLLPEMLITKLEQSGGFQVIPWERLSELKKQLDKSDVEFVNRELGYQLAAKDGVQMMVTGSLIRAGDWFSLDAKVMNAETKQILKSVNVRGQGEESLLISQIDELGEEIARGLGNSESLTKSLQEPLQRYTTSSTEAYKLYHEARYMWPAKAIPLLEKAINIDTTFTRAYFALSLKYNQRQQLAKYAETFKKAMKHSTKAPEQERLSIQTWYYFHFKGDYSKADSIGQLYVD